MKCVDLMPHGFATRTPRVEGPGISNKRLIFKRMNSDIEMCTTIGL